MTWFKDNKPVLKTKTMTTEFDGTNARLVVSAVQSDDSAIYKCVAENDTGKDQIKSKVTITGKPELLTFIICCICHDHSSRSGRVVNAIDCGA